MDRSYLTAIRRNKPSAPISYLYGHYINYGSILDFGCGRGDDVEWLRQKGFDVVGFDPYWLPNEHLLERKYHTVLCTYVLNVLPPAKRKVVLAQVKSLVSKYGRAYLTVRRDIPIQLKTKRGTRQYPVKLDLPVVEQNSRYCIYEYQHDV